DKPHATQPRISTNPGTRPAIDPEAVFSSETWKAYTAIRNAIDKLLVDGDRIASELDQQFEDWQRKNPVG
ncbi:MAG: hypothetical protein AABZ06_04520, partial [Bdellovibrionota bacterium]